MKLRTIPVVALATLLLALVAFLASRPTTGEALSPVTGPRSLAVEVNLPRDELYYFPVALKVTMPKKVSIITSDEPFRGEVTLAYPGHGPWGGSKRWAAISRCEGQFISPADPSGRLAAERAEELATKPRKIVWLNKRVGRTSPSSYYYAIPHGYCLELSSEDHALVRFLALHLQAKLSDYKTSPSTSTGEAVGSQIEKNVQVSRRFRLDFKQYFCQAANCEEPIDTAVVEVDGSYAYLRPSLIRLKKAVWIRSGSCWRRSKSKDLLNGIRGNLLAKLALPELPREAGWADPSLAADGSGEISFANYFSSGKLGFDSTQRMISSEIDLPLNAKEHYKNSATVTYPATIEHRQPRPLCPSS